MTQKELLEFNAFRAAAKITLKEALKQRDLTYWEYYKAKKQMMAELPENSKDDSGAFIPVVFSDSHNSKMTKSKTRSRRETELAKGNILTIEMRMSTGPELRIQGQMNISMLREILITTSGEVKDV